ncbi:unnamed protein product [Darwinula stevensoni]|uniref:Uncharacterized protein n=1 Tax=Darwinula stevensoni TaxID=69355 RepID=A0A7R9FRR0_9CRUS|nr:unnamed protein product [Darwinula stevensoni]CAG0901783.1 unnamed protein product [Darwinula stevensoni]
MHVGLGRGQLAETENNAGCNFARPSFVIRAGSFVAPSFYAVAIASHSLRHALALTYGQTVLNLRPDNTWARQCARNFRPDNTWRVEPRIPTPTAGQPNGPRCAQKCEPVRIVNCREFIPSRRPGPRSADRRQRIRPSTYRDELRGSPPYELLHNVEYFYKWEFEPGEKEKITFRLDFLECGAKLTCSMSIDTLAGSRIGFRVEYEAASIGGSFPPRRGKFSQIYGPTAESDGV